MTPRLQAQTVARCIEGLDRFLASIPADGAIDEGFAYWWNGAGRALEGLALLEEATGGVLDADLPVVRELVAFPHRMHLGGNWFLNVADGPARAAGGLPWDMLHRWAVRLGDPEAAAARRRLRPPVRRIPTAGLGRVLHALLAPAGTELAAGPKAGASRRSVAVHVPAVGADHGGPAKPPARRRACSWPPRAGTTASTTTTATSARWWLPWTAFPLLVDAGQPTYTAKTFGPDRYGIRAMQSAWHSVPAPFGLEQGTGEGVRGRRPAGAHTQEQPHAGAGPRSGLRSEPRSMDPHVLAHRDSPAGQSSPTAGTFPDAGRTGRNGRRRHHLPRGGNREPRTGRDGDRPARTASRGCARRARTPGSGACAGSRQPPSSLWTNGCWTIRCSRRVGRSG